MNRVAAAVLVETQLGTVGVEATEVGIRRVHLPDAGSRTSETPGIGSAAAAAVDAAAQLEEYMRGERQTFDVVLDWQGVEDPRDVGVLMARNPLPLVVPCHRVVASDGLGGYGGGLELKRRLLELECVLPPRLDLGDV